MAFLDNVIEKLKITSNTLLSNYAISVYGGEGVHIEGHKGVGYMSSEEIVFKVKKGTISIKGDALKIKEIDTYDAYVTGKITGVELGGANG